MPLDAKNGYFMNIFIQILILLFIVLMATPSEALQVVERPAAPSGLGVQGAGGQVVPLKVTERPAFSVSPSNFNSFATPLAYYQGNIYVVSVEPPVGASNGMNLRTVVRKGYEDKGEWIWETTVVDDSTLDDVYHTQASIAIDKAGYVHITYNMHHMPWQYAVSNKPGDISSFDFRGDAISLAEKGIVKNLNKTPFPSIGTAAIPGNQITYPAFFYDRSGDLYITYRFATRPNRSSFSDRGYAYAIARYDVVNRQWSQLGAQVKVTINDADLPAGLQEGILKVFVFSEDWIPQLLRIFFDKTNRMHFSWTWREFYENAPFLKSSYAYSPAIGERFYQADGTQFALPMRAVQAGLLVTNNPSTELISPLAYLTVHPNGTPYVVTLEKGTSSVVRFYDNKAKRWSKAEPMPEGAQLMEIDDAGHHWAFAAGLTLYKRNVATEPWSKMYEDTELSRFGFFKVLYVRKQNLFLVFSQSEDGNSAKVYEIRY
jgi:hypothetical protein